MSANPNPMDAPYPGMKAYPAKYFHWKEVACHHCGKFPEKETLESFEFKLIASIAFAIRVEVGRPLIVSSWYRCENHPLEAVKRRPGVHTTGLAIDVLIRHGEVIRSLSVAQRAVAREYPEYDVHTRLLGIGLRQKGDVATRFAHIDIAGLHKRFPRFRPALWTY